MLRELVMDEVAPLPQFRPANELPRPFGSVFRSLQAIQDTGLEITNSYRHQRFSVSAAAESPGGHFGLAIDSSGRRVARAQVFAVGATGPRGSVDTRFLGFSAADGSFSCSGLDTNSDLLLVGEDGSVGMVARPLGTTAVINVPMQSGGRVRLDESLRDSSPYQGFVTIRFQRASASLEGMEPVATRFVSAATSWEIVDVPPGDYIVTIDSVVLHVNVPESGTLLLR